MKNMNTHIFNSPRGLPTQGGIISRGIDTYSVSIEGSEI